MAAEERRHAALLLLGAKKVRSGESSSGGDQGFGAAAFGEDALDEGDFATKNIGDLVTEFRLGYHEIQERVPVDVHDLCRRDCGRGQAVCVSGEGGWQPQKRTAGENAIELRKIG